jgi:hypothetical protein
MDMRRGLLILSLAIKLVAALATPRGIAGLYGLANTGSGAAGPLVTIDVSTGFMTPVGGSLTGELVAQELSALDVTMQIYYVIGTRVASYAMRSSSSRQCAAFVIYMQASTNQQMSRISWESPRLLEISSPRFRWGLLRAPLSDWGKTSHGSQSLTT